MAKIAIQPQDARRLKSAVTRIESRGLAGMGLGGFDSTPPPGLLGLVSAGDDGGWYNVKIWKPPAGKISVAGGLTAAVLGTAGADAYYGNLTELGKSTHDLMDEHNTATTLFVGIRWGTAEDGKPIYVGNGIWLDDCAEEDDEGDGG